MIQIKNKLYLITDERLMSRRSFLAQARKAAAAGAGLIQLREKSSILRDRAELARELAALARKAGVKLIINDDPWLAKLIGADGVHLGMSDPPVELARALLGEAAIIGVSCYGDVRRAVEMEKRGASYVSFGACFPSPTKPKEPEIPLALFKEAKSRLRVPIVAIGGITSSNAPRVLKAGADCLAVVSSVFGAPNIERAARNLKMKMGPSYSSVGGEP